MTYNEEGLLYKQQLWNPSKNVTELQHAN